ncbi:hypothetical protein IC229_34575 [Spirosoma sp. BT702]|uniref:RNA polymerase sigma-70 region 2 domain-containing protein n=1 Tax=Spirosoma profusum TaxID=2771354 RepID=A0A927AWP4_9BACT|nr:hypothetical protein [Spirosoma profusum]
MNMANPLSELVAKWPHYQPMILSYLRKLVNDKSIAQDISQEFFLKVYRLVIILSIPSLISARGYSK